MEKVYDKCCGIDVHKKLIAACFKKGSRELNRLQKMLEGANIKISGTITDINGRSARNILEYILSGKPIGSAEYDFSMKRKSSHII